MNHITTTSPMPKKAEEWLVSEWKRCFLPIVTIPLYKKKVKVKRKKKAKL